MVDKIGGQNQSFQPVIKQIQEKIVSSKLIGIERKQEINQVTSPMDKGEMEKIVQGMNDFLKPAGTHLKFEFHDELKEYYVSIVDDVTHEVVKEIPAKKMLDMYAEMTEFLGILVDRKI